VIQTVGLGWSSFSPNERRSVNKSSISSVSLNPASGNHSLFSGKMSRLENIPWWPEQRTSGKSRRVRSGSRAGWRSHATSPRRDQFSPATRFAREGANSSGELNTAAFVVRRTGDTNAELTVLFSVHGTAVNGEWITRLCQVRSPFPSGATPRAWLSRRFAMNKRRPVRNSAARARTGTHRSGRLLATQSANHPGRRRR